MQDSISNSYKKWHFFFFFFFKELYSVHFHIHFLPDLIGLYPCEFVTLSCSICVLTHCIMNGVSYCINSLIYHVSDAELRCVSVWVLDSLYVLCSITRSLLHGCQ